MTITEVRKKLKTCKSLLSEYDMIKATINAVKRVDKGSGIKLDENYLFNMEKRLGVIEKQFDNLLK